MESPGGCRVSEGALTAFYPEEFYYWIYGSTNVGDFTPFVS